MIALKKNKTVILKNKLINLFMQNGSKQICEKNLLKSSKILQKSSKKRFQSLLQLSIINTALTFKFNEKIIKKSEYKFEDTMQDLLNFWRNKIQQGKHFLSR